MLVLALLGANSLQSLPRAEPGSSSSRCRVTAACGGSPCDGIADTCLALQVTGSVGYNSLEVTLLDVTSSKAYDWSLWIKTGAMF